MKKFWTKLASVRTLTALITIFLISGCGTVHPPEPGDDGGPKPTDLRKHVMEVLKPDSLFRMNWSSQIGEVNEQTQMIMSEVSSTKFYIGSLNIRTYIAWKYCVTLINPPYKTKENARVGVMTVIVRNDEGYIGQNSCLWYDPTDQYKESVKLAIASAEER